MKLIETVENIIQSEFTEMLTKNKDIFAHGVEHRLFESKKYPDKLYKVSYESTVNKWIPIFQKNPKYFPKIFNTGTIKYGNKILKYVLIEKVDTDKHHDEWKLIEEVLEEIGESVYIDAHFRDLLLNDDDEHLQQIDIKFKQYNPQVYKLYIDWVNFLFKVNSIVKPYKRGNIIDLHRYNFGYKMNGHKVCLDI